MKKHIQNGIIAISSLLFVSFLYQKTTILFLILMLLSLLIVKLNYSKNILKLYIFSFFFGPLSEALAVHGGAWSYAKFDTFLKIPLWLFPLWGLAGVFLATTYLYFERKK